MPYYFPVNITVIQQGSGDDNDNGDDNNNDNGDFVMATIKQETMPANAVNGDIWQRINSAGITTGLLQFHFDLNRWEDVFARPILQSYRVDSDWYSVTSDDTTLSDYPPEHYLSFPCHIGTVKIEGEIRYMQTETWEYEAGDPKPAYIFVERYCKDLTTYSTIAYREIGRVEFIPTSDKWEMIIPVSFVFQSTSVMQGLAIAVYNPYNALSSDKFRENTFLNLSYREVINV
jgi:hypothetical protein